MIIPNSQVNVLGLDPKLLKGKTIIKPHPGGQTKFLSVDVFEILFGGAAGSGKTFGLVFDALGLHFKNTPLKKYAIEVPEYRSVKVRKISSRDRTYLTSLKTFFEWLCIQTIYKSKICSSTLQYLRVTRKESRLAVQSNPREFPMMQYVKQLVDSKGIKSIIDRLDQALIAYTFLTGMRDAAIVSLPIKCLDEERLWVYQDPKKGAKTKSPKPIVSKIFQFDDELLEIVLQSIKYLRAKGISSENPVFPRSKNEMVEKCYSFNVAEDIEPYFWTTANRMRKIFQARVTKSKLPYYVPQTFRNAAVFYALKEARNGEEIKAIFQTLAMKI